MTTVENKTQFRATCPICFKNHAVKGALMVDHGYTRPEGWHQNNGGCGGERQPHFGTPEGRAVTVAEAKRMFAYAKAQDAMKQKFERGEFETLTVMKGFGTHRKSVVVEKGTPDYDKEQRHSIWVHNNNAQRARDWMKELDQLVFEWVAKEAVEHKIVRSGPLYHLYTKNWGKTCAGSRMGAQKGDTTSDLSKVTCPKCLAIQGARTDEFN